MKLYLKVIGCSCYTCLPRTLPAAARTARKMATLGTAPVARRLLTIVSAKHSPAHTHTCKQGQKYKKQYNIT
jgi:hypothetical protein